MTVRKPIKNVNELGIDALIERGAKVREEENKKKKRCHINLRIPPHMLELIDEARENRIGSRTAWVLEAIQEKLQKKNG